MLRLNVSTIIAAVLIGLVSPAQAEDHQPNAAAASAPATAKHSRPAHMSLALIGVTRGEGFSQGQATTVEDLLLGALDASKRFKVIGQADIGALLNLEAKKQALGCSDDSACMTQIAGALGADLVATASIGRLGQNTVVSLRVIEVSSAVVIARAQEIVQNDNALTDAASHLVAQVVQTIWPGASTGQGGSLPAQALSPTARLAHRIGWSSAIIGGVALLVGAGLAINVRIQQNQIKSTPRPTDTTLHQVNSVNSQALGANVLFAAGGVLGAAGLGVVIAF